MELDEFTDIIRFREKNIQLTFWDIGNDLNLIKAQKLYLNKYKNMEQYIEYNFTFSARQGWKMMSVANNIHDRTKAGSIGLEKLYLLLQVPELYRDEILGKVQDNVMTRSELQTQIRKFKKTVGEPPKHSKDGEEYVLKLKREWQCIKENLANYNHALKNDVQKWYDKAIKFKEILHLEISEALLLMDKKQVKDYDLNYESVPN